MEQQMIHNSFIYRRISQYSHDAFFHYLMIRNDEIRLLFCQHLLPDKTLVSTTIYHGERYPSYLKNKKFILDILAKDDQGNIYNIEMQKRGIHKSDIIRFQCYGARILAETPKKGSVGYDKLEDVYQLIINAGTNIEGMEFYEECYVMTGEKYKRTLPYAKLYSTYIQLQYINERVDEVGGIKNLDTFDQIMYLFAKGELNGIIEPDNLVKEVINMHESFLCSDEAFFAYNAEREELLIESYIHESWSGGIEEGEKQGREAGEICGMRKMLQQLVLKKYHVDKNEWINECDIQQLNKAIDFIVCDLEYEKFKEKVLKG
ncbi:MAG: PD-(D/E)XK nuclease family transposase [Coprobacillus sp.]